MGRGETIDLFDDDRSKVLNGRGVERAKHSSAPRRPRQKPQKTRARGLEAGKFTVEDHVCQKCFGRLVSEPVTGKRRRYVCTNCGAEAAGTSPDVLCACGLRLRSHQAPGATVDAGLRCQANPNPTPEFPSLVVAAPVAS